MVVTTSIFLAAVIALGEATEGNQIGDYAVGIIVLFLPIMASLGLGIDLAMAWGSPMLGTTEFIISHEGVTDSRSERTLPMRKLTRTIVVIQVHRYNLEANRLWTIR